MGHFLSRSSPTDSADEANFYELYAIAAAVLGGCSLRGGEGSILGVLIGATLIQVLRNTITLGPPTTTWSSPSSAR